MKIRKLKIKNYKIFDDVEFDFTDADGNTLDTVVLAGVNGCGKTTVLEVIKDFLLHKILFSIIEKVEIEFDILPEEFIALKNRYSQFDSYEQNLLESKGKISFGHNAITLNSQSLDFDMGYLLAVLFGANTPHRFVYFPVSGSSNISRQKPFFEELFIGNNKAEMKQLALKQIRDEVFKNKDIPPKQVINNQIENLTRALSSLYLNTTLVDLESEELVFESANGQRIYFEQLSHGEQNLYFRAIYLSLLNLKDSIIMVDEPEGAFHPKWQQGIAQLYRNVGENNQVFLATHSPHIMASVPSECLFMLHIDESEGKRKIRVINAAKAGKHSQGLEPDRILKEIMQVKTLRDYETQRDIDELTRLLTLESFESERAEELADKLTTQLGREDPFIIRLEHQMLMLRRKKPDLAVA